MEQNIRTPNPLRKREKGEKDEKEIIKKTKARNRTLRRGSAKSNRAKKLK